jgi:hypothetical protein
MYDGLHLEYRAKMEYDNRINDPNLTRRAQVHRELAMMTRTGNQPGRTVVARIGLVFSRIGNVFSAPRPVANQA